MQDNEIWKPVLGYEGYYEVSNLGRVKSLDRIIDGRWGLSQIRGRLMKSHLNFGYSTIILSIHGVKKNKTVHRLVAQSFVKNLDNYKYVNHINGDKADNKSSNLEWCTMEYNNHHKCTVLGFDNKGENNGQSKLTEVEVFKIRNLYIPRVYTASMLAQEYNVSISCVESVLYGYSWKHI